jgi:uroporphyrinogen-III synthase
MTSVIVLRPEPGASETVARARELGLEAMSIPLFKVEPLEWRVPDANRFDALLLTSANAVRHGGAGLGTLNALPVHAVGEATAEAARAAGFTVATIGEGGIDLLMAALDPGLRLLHLCGEPRRPPADPRQAITAVPVYRSRAIEPALDLCAASEAVVLVHSPRAADRFAELIDRAEIPRRSVAIAAISEAAAAAAGEGWAAIHVADAPTDDALLALAARLCNKPGGE